MNFIEMPYGVRTPSVRDAAAVGGEALQEKINPGAAFAECGRN